MSGHSDDELLIERSRQGDREAFDTLIENHEKRAYQYALRLTSNPDEASDIVSDAFIRIYTALKNFKGNSAFNTWMYRILTNCYLDHRKRERNRQHSSLDATTGTDPAIAPREFEDRSEGPIELAERDAREQMIQTAIARLPEYQQAMLVMYHGESLSYEEIAEALDLPLGTVKSRLNRARLSLRELLIGNEELFRIG